MFTSILPPYPPCPACPAWPPANQRKDMLSLRRQLSCYHSKRKVKIVVKISTLLIRLIDNAKKKNAFRNKELKEHWSLFGTSD
jgi:hypothetical protein